MRSRIVIAYTSLEVSSSNTGNMEPEDYRMASGRWCYTIDEEVIENDNAMEASIHEVHEGLFLGNVAAATEELNTHRLNVTHILTVDLVPLARTYVEGAPHITFEYLRLADVVNEDLISNLPGTSKFIKEAIDNKGKVLVHCYFGVSRSAAIVIAYIMERDNLSYEEAYIQVKGRRPFIGPNSGFVSQLKLFGNMGFKLDYDAPIFKQFRLKMAGQTLKKGGGKYDHCPRHNVKILPQLFADLVKPDPGLIRERPEPIVYKCKKCRRIVASQNNIIPHIPKYIKIEMAKKGVRPPPSTLTGLHCAENGQILIEKLRNLATQVIEGTESAGAGSSDTSDEVPSQDAYLDQNMVDTSVVSHDEPQICRDMWFVEPMAWMKNVTRDPHGKLHCPKCQSKIGSFSWVCGCKCPCGQKVAPAFYLVPSKVEWSNVVQNVQITL